MRAHPWLFSAQLLLGAAAAAGPPLIDNSMIESRRLDGSLSTAVSDWAGSIRDPAWLGWHVSMLKKQGSLCCGTRGDRGLPEPACDLESSHRHFVFSSEPPLLSKNGGNLVVLLRAEGERVAELRAYSDDCRLDATGARVTWLEGVKPTESVDLLSHWIEDGSVIKDEALMAMALHAAPAAAERLVGMASHSPDSDLRGEALFWLSQTGADNAAAVILRALAEDPEAKVRSEAVFALSQLPDGEGMPWLLEILRDRSRPGAVREEAFFWYVQSGDDRALALIAEILGR